MLKNPFPHLFATLLAPALVAPTLVALLSFLPALCSAEFVLTMASGVYQHTDGRTKVIVGSHNGARGIFVLVAREPINPQEFNVETTPRDAATHVFVKFDEDSQPPVYSEVWAAGKQYKIAGNLTVNVGGNTTVSIDNNNPYLSIVTEPAAAGGKPAILAFSGLNEVVRATGAAATIVAANQLDSNVALMMQPYVATDTELTLNGKPIGTPTIGTFVKPESDCLKSDTLLLTGNQMAQVQGAKSEDQRIKLLEQVIKGNRKDPPLKGQLVLRSDPKSVVLLDIAEKNVREMHPIKGNAGKRKLCLISDLAVK